MTDLVFILFILITRPEIQMGNDVSNIIYRMNSLVILKDVWVVLFKNTRKSERIAERVIRIC